MLYASRVLSCLCTELNILLIGNHVCKKTKPKNTFYRFQINAKFIPICSLLQGIFYALLIRLRYTRKSAVLQVCFKNTVPCFNNTMTCSDDTFSVLSFYAFREQTHQLCRNSTLDFKNTPFKRQNTPENRYNTLK